MSARVVALIVTLLAGAAYAQIRPQPETRSLHPTSIEGEASMDENDASPGFVSLSPVLVVDEIEPCLPLWEAKLGFQRVAEVPQGEGGRLGFVMLQKDAVTVMYQTRESVREDVPAIEEETSGGATALFITVRDLDAVAPLLEGEDVFLPRRTTFYGADEIGVRGACGHLFTFAEFAEAGGGGEG